MPISPPITPPSGGGSTGGNASTGTGASAGFSQVNGPYWLLLTESGLTFTSGIGADWSALFTAPETSSPIPTLNGELEVGDLTTGLCAMLAVKNLNPWTNAAVWIEASVGAPTQIRVSDVIQEITASALVSLDFIGGVDVIAVTRAAGPLIVRGVVWDGRIAAWQSLYGLGLDPYLADSGAGPTLSALGVGGAGGL